MTTLLRNCNQHGVLAARLASERPGSVIRLSKEFTRLVVRTVKAFVTVEVFGTGKKKLRGARAALLLLPACHFIRRQRQAFFSLLYISAYNMTKCGTLRLYPTNSIYTESVLK